MTLLFYYEDLSVEEIAQLLNLSLATVKSRLFQGRKQLQEQLRKLYPEFSPRLMSKQRRKTMAHVRMNLIKVVLVEQRLLVVLLDPSSQRVLTLWLHPLEGRTLAVLKGVVHVSAPKGSFEPSAHLEFVSDLLQATGATLQAVHLEELQERVFYSQVVLQSLNGTQQVKARLGDGLALAVRANSPLLVEDTVLARWAINLPAEDGKTLELRLNEVVDIVIANARPSASPRLRRIPEPQNLLFAQGLERWELRGDFLLDASGLHWQDYTSGIDEIGPQPGRKSGYLKAQVPQPQGFADLRQAILAENYQGKHIRLSADIKTEGVEQQAGLYLRVIDPGMTKPPEERQQVTFQGTRDWTRGEIQVEVPPESMHILFGISLTGKGQVWMTNVQLESVETISEP
jgi:bifunctional DNase/RNase